MADRLDGVLAGIVAALTQPSVVVNNVTRTMPERLTAYRMRMRPVEADEELDFGPVALVWWAGDDPVQYDLTLQATRTARVKVQGQVRQTGSSPDAALIPLRAWIVQAVMADVTLGEAAADINEGESAPQLEEREDGLCAVDVEFMVTYHTAYNDPEVVG
jgi:hypothetical protein